MAKATLMQEHRDLEPPPALSDLQARGPLALFVDFDGTLVDLARTPDEIDVPKGLGVDLCALARRLDNRLALVSGRAINDIDRHLGTHPLARAGSHGIDRLDAQGNPLGDPAEGMPDEVQQSVRRFADEAGVDLEEKTHGCALHFRRMPALEERAIAFARELADEHDLAIKHGKGIVELVHPGAHKGGAVRAFMQVEPFAGALPVFIGDDVTDEDGMEAAADLGGFGILVGDPRPTAARYRLPGTRAVHEWLGI